MHFPKLIGLLVVCSILQFKALSQDKIPVKFGKVSASDFEINSSLVDTSDDAVVIADYGLSEYMPNTFDLSFSLIYVHKMRAKVIKRNGFDIATVEIPLYVGLQDKGESLESLKAYTYNLENGKVVETKVDKDMVYTERINKFWVHKKFTFPALKEGSIIEFSYEIRSDYIFNLQPWEFQGKYPVLWSQYQANIPNFFKYTMISQGYQPFYINDITEVPVSYNFRVREDRGGLAGVAGSTVQDFSINGQIQKHNWVIKDVPALKNEPFNTTIGNHITKIEFQLNQIAYPNTLPQNFSNSWEKVSNELMEDEKFGGLIKKDKGWMDDIIGSITTPDMSPVIRAKKIYEYVRDNFVCTSKSAYKASDNLRAIYKSQKGSVADINLFLIALLRNADINVYPVILSTRSHGVTHEYYPLMDRYNYVIAQVSFDEGILYLDASEPMLGYGKLPGYCYNGFARSIDGTGSSVYFSPDSLKEKSSTVVMISETDKGEMIGNIAFRMGDVESNYARFDIAKNGLEEYIKDIKDDFDNDLEIQSVTVDSVHKFDYPVKVNIDFTDKNFKTADMIYFDPVLSNNFRTNPFKADKRYYPIEMPYLMDKQYVLNMEVPKGYVVDELPKSVRISFNEDEGMFEYLISESNGYIQLRSKLVFYKSTFSQEDYQNLREFFDFVISKNQEKIVFKKSN